MSERNPAVMSDSFGDSTSAGQQGYNGNTGAFGSNDQANHPEHDDVMGRDTGNVTNGAMGTDDQRLHPEHDDALKKDTNVENRREDAMNYGTHHEHGKPKMINRIAGTIEEMAGKVLHNHALEERGKQLKHPDAPTTTTTTTTAPATQEGPSTSAVA